jgi:hypothetical protein
VTDDEACFNERKRKPEADDNVIKRHTNDWASGEVGMIGAALFFFLPLVALGAGCLGYGLATGRMPARSGSYNRQTQPVPYWIMGAAYVGVLVFGCWNAFKPLLGL